MPTTSTFSPTCALIDFSALSHNLTQCRRLLSPDCDVMAVVKANAYGHGSVETTQALLRQGVTRVAVVSVEEGATLRQAGIDAPVLVLGPLFPGQICDLLAHRLTPVVSDLSVLAPLAKAAESLAAPYPVHLKVDTGMGRLGLTLDEFVTLLTSHNFPRSLRLEGLMTHLADTDGATTETTEHQLAQFNRAIDTLTACGFSTPFIHAANSGGAVRFPTSHFSLVRLGIMLYGYHTMPPSVVVPPLQPVLSLKTCVAQIRTIRVGQTVSYNATFTARRPTRVAVLPIGYADGVSRRLSNRGHVLIQGRRAPIAGLVCMDMMLVDVTDIPGVTIGDETVLIGRQGRDQITATDMAAWLETIPYEVLCSIGPRVPRLYQTA